MVLNLNFENKYTATTEPKANPAKTRDNNKPSCESVSFKLFLIFAEADGSAP